MRLPNALLLLFLLVALNGCATIIHGTTQDISVTTDPADADLLVDGNLRYKSPATITMKRKDDHTVEISREGYKSEKVDIKGTISAGSGWVIFSPEGRLGMALTQPPGLNAGWCLKKLRCACSRYPPEMSATRA